jgi:23S rRNA (cytosine1962-C5)-methyltransferase
VSGAGRSVGRSATSALPRVTLRKNLARAIRRGHPWIFRDALARSAPLPDGAVVLVAGPDGRPLARGFWDARSPIAVRILGAEPSSVPALVAARAAEALDRRLGFIDRAQTDAFRWIHGEADDLPGIHVDLYGAIATIRHDGDGARAFYRELPRLLQEAAVSRGLTLSSVVERRRGRGATGGDDRAAAALAVLGALPRGEVEVRENGLRFGVDVTHGQKGGLFLDQRDNRARVRALAPGRQVLNLFGYTGGFSVYAAAGGAARTTTVDLAAPAIEAARRNFARNGLPLDPARFVAGDAFAFLEREAAAGARYDLVISDPPSFASSERAVPRALGAYRRLHQLAAAVTAPGGLLCAASCSSHVGQRDFLATVEAGAARAGRRFTLEGVTGAGPDHPTRAAFPEGDYLKFAVGRL